MAKTVVISKDNDMTIIMFTYGNGGREKEKRQVRARRDSNHYCDLLKMNTNDDGGGGGDDDAADDNDAEEKDGDI